MFNKAWEKNEAIYFFQNAKKIKEVPNRLAKNFPELSKRRYFPFIIFSILIICISIMFFFF